MAGTVTASAIKIWDAESVTGWTTNKGDVYSGFQREGSYCLGDQVSETTFHEIYDYLGTVGSALNLEGKLVTFWVLIWGQPDTLANGGVRYYLEDSAGNAVALYVGGGDKTGVWWGAGWQAFAVYLDSTWTPANVTYEQIAGTAFPDLTSIAKVGVGFKILSKAIGLSPNVFWDVCYAVDYLQITGGTATDPATFKDLADADSSTTNAWGIIVESQPGVYEIQGVIRIGDTATDTYFIDKGNLVIFRDAWVPDGLYKIDVYRGSANTTVFQLGEKSGEAGINGCVFRAPSNKRYRLDSYTNYDVTAMATGDVGIYGTSVYYAYEVKLPDSSYGEVLTSNFINSGTVYAYQTTIKGGTNFIGSSVEALWLPLNHNTSNCNLISNYIGVMLTAEGTYTFDAIKFTGNTYDIENTTTGTITVNCVNGSNPTTTYNPNGGTTNIINTVYVTVDVVDKNLNPIEGAQVWVYNLTDGVEIMNQATDTNGRAQTTVNYTGDKSLEIRVRKSTPPTTRYIPVRTYGTLTSDGFSTTITLYEDTVVA
jgi:hypothetical protein